MLIFMFGMVPVAVCLSNNGEKQAASSSNGKDECAHGARLSVENDTVFKRKILGKCGTVKAIEA